MVSTYSATTSVLVTTRRVLLGFALVFLAIPAFGDSIDMVVTGQSYSSAGEGSNGFYMSTYPDSSNLQFFGGAQTNPNQEYFLPFPSFTLPVGAHITSATVTASFPSVVRFPTYIPTIGEPGPRVDQDNPYFVRGVITATPIAYTSFDGVSAYSASTSTGCEVGTSSKNVNLIGAGFGPCLKGTVHASVFFDSETWLVPDLVSPGFNSSEIFNFEYGDTVDVSADLHIDYNYGAAPTPEPSTLILMFLGIAGIGAGVYSRRSAIPRVQENLFR
jgi:hypothetical protein